MIQAIKAALKAGLHLLDGVPMGAVIKAAVGLGVMAFTTYVLIKRTRKMAEKDKQNVSPVDEILENNYLVDSEVFDDMDPEARKICKKLHRGGWRKRKKRKNGVYAEKKARNDEPIETVSLFEDMEIKGEKEEGGTNQPYIFQPYLFNNGKMGKKKKRTAEQKRRTRQNIEQMRREAIEYIDSLGKNMKNVMGYEPDHIYGEPVSTIDDDDDLDLDDDLDRDFDDLKAAGSAIF